MLEGVVVAIQVLARRLQRAHPDHDGRAAEHVVGRVPRSSAAMPLLILTTTRAFFREQARQFRDNRLAIEKARQQSSSSIV